MIFNVKEKNKGSFMVMYKDGFMVFIGDMEVFFDYGVDNMEFVIILIVGLG